MLEGIHHINFLVADLDAAILRYKDLFDIDAMTIESLPQRGVRTARFELSGVWIVLVQPVDEQSEPIIMLSAANLRSVVTGRMTRDEDSGPTRRADLSSIVRTVRWKPSSKRIA